MKTLYDRLKPELKQELELRAKEYPISFDLAKNALLNNYHWTDLKVSEVTNLFMLLHKNFSLENLWDYFYEN